MEGTKGVANTWYCIVLFFYLGVVNGKKDLLVVVKGKNSLLRFLWNAKEIPVGFLLVDQSVGWCLALVEELSEE